MKRRSKLTIAVATAVLAALGGTAVYAQDKYSLISPSGIAFSDFKGIRGLGGGLFRPDRRSAQGDRRQSDHDQGVQGRRSGQRPAFPEGSKIAKLQWKPKKSTEAPFVVDVPDVFTQAFVIEKDSKRFPKSGGWGYALFNYDAASDKFTADPSPSDCGHACHVAVKAKDHIFHPYQKR